MSEAEAKDLINCLQRTNRRWKILALISTSFLAVLLLATGVSNVVQWRRAEAERDVALKMQEEAMAQRDRIEQQRRDAEEAAKEAEQALKAAEEKVLKEVERAKKKEK
jgi:hypothetical protein